MKASINFRSWSKTELDSFRSISPFRNKWKVVNQNNPARRPTQEPQADVAGMAGWIKLVIGWEILWKMISHSLPLPDKVPISAFIFNPLATLRIEYEPSWPFLWLCKGERGVG